MLGKGNKERSVSVPTDVVGELSHYLASRGLDRDPEHPENRGAFLIGCTSDIATRAPWSTISRALYDPKAGIASGTLYGQLKTFFLRCGDALAATDSKGAERLRAGSTHWLRHTHGTHAMASGMTLDAIRQKMGHASLDTTTGYPTSEERRRMIEAARLWAGRS